MPSAATIAVLADCVWLAAAAMVVGMVVYGVLRNRGALVDSGRVWVERYEPPDIVMAVLVIYLMTSAIMTSAGLGDKAEPTVLTVGGVMMSICASLAITMIIVAYLRFVRGLNPAELFGLTLVPLRKVLLVVLVAIAPVLILVAGIGAGMEFILKGWWPEIAPQATVIALLKTPDTLVRTLMILAAVVIAPLSEELLFRGYIYGVCKRFTDAPYAAVISALLFAVVHVHVASFVPLFVLALLLVWFYERTGSLLVPMLLHAAFNGWMIIAMFWQGLPK